MYIKNIISMDYLQTSDINAVFLSAFFYLGAVTCEDDLCAKFI